MRSRLALGLVMVAMLILPVRGMFSMALAQDDATPEAGTSGELVVDGQRYALDQPVALDPAQLQERTDDSGATIYVKPGDDPLGAVYAPGSSGLDRYLPEHLDAPDTACPSEATAVGTIEGNGAIYIPSGIEPDVSVDQLTQIGSTADGRTLYAPTADQPFEVLYATGADGGLVRYLLVQENGVPATFPDRITFAGQEFQLTAGETPTTDGLQKVGCAVRFPALADSAEAGGPYSAIYLQIPNGFVVYRSVGQPEVTPTEPAIVPVETEAPATIAPTEVPPTAVPTEVPTEVPTAIPTEVPPTVAPTEIPATAVPTEVPTAVPTEVPPTAVPTEVPPTVAPTLAPTEAPPTAAPTEAPTEVPPTEAPPTAGPTQAAPTQAPTEAPPTAAPTEAPQGTAAPTQAPAPTATSTPRPTPTPRPLEPQAVVPTLPPSAPPPAASTATTTGCTGDAGEIGSNGLPSRLPTSLQYGGTGYRFVKTVPVSEIGDLTRVGCVGPFEAFRSADDDALYLTLENVADSAWRYEQTSSFTVRTEVSDTPRSLTLQGTGDQPDVTYRASDPLVRSVYSSVTLILYVADAETATPDRVLGYAVDRDVFGEYLPESEGEPVSEDIQAQAEELGIHPTLTIGNGDQTYVLVALWRPFGTTTNGWLTLYGPEGETAPEQLVGIDPRRLDLQIFNRAD